MADEPETQSSEAIWRDLAERALRRGLDTLESRSADDLRIEPLYSRRRDDPPQPWQPEKAWSVAQPLDHPDPEIANRFALHDLEGGTDALVLVGAESPFSRGFGLTVDPGAIDILFDKVELDLISLRLDVGAATQDTLEALGALVERRHLGSAALPIDIGHDPIGWQARTGRPCPVDARRLMDVRAKAGLGGTVFLADGRPYHEADAGEAQELAAVLATAVGYLRQAEALGLPLDVAGRSIAVLLAADADVFLGIAKFRAMRRLWARVMSASGLEPAALRVHGETSWRMMTRNDPWTNVMRATAATFAAGIGGADCATALPMTAVRGLADEPARRLARNMQRVLLDEAHLGMVADPAAGAGGFESLTEALCQEAWRLFQEIERQGGMENERARRGVAAMIAETAAGRARRRNERRDAIVGTTRYAGLGQAEIAVLDVPPRPPLEAGGDALPALRDAAPFEALRDRIERAAATGTDTHVFLAALGPSNAVGPMLAETIHFFAIAGIPARANLGTQDMEAVVRDFASSGTPVACLCLSPGPPEVVQDLAMRLRTAGAVYIATHGAPAADAARPQDCGVDAFIFEGCPALDILGSVVEKLLPG